MHKFLNYILNGIIHGNSRDIKVLQESCTKFLQLLDVIVIKYFESFLKLLE
jgi:hypothetical protein